MKFFHIAAIATSLTLSIPAQAKEVFGGVLKHEVDTPLSLKSREGGVNFQLGFRGEKIEGLKAIGKPAPYIFVSANSKGDTSFLAAGLSWTLGKKAVYVRPAIGLAVHDGKIPRSINGRRYDLGSRVLFEPEIGVGFRFTDKLSAELQWTHISNARILSSQNPGIDMIGVRVNLGL
jgi:lipid A 3-O-deacylase